MSDNFEQMLSDPVQCLQKAKEYQNSNLHDFAIAFADSIQHITTDKDLIYQAQEIISISGYYSSQDSNKLAGKQNCEYIALDKNLSWHQREVARRNSIWYSNSLKELCPSTSFKSVDFIPDHNYQPTNPSISANNNRIWMIQRAVNYLINSDGSYNMNGDSAIRTNNYLLELDNNLNILSSEIINLPRDLPLPNYNLVLGFEDCRLFFWKGEAWCTSTVRQLTPEGWCQIVLAKISNIGSGNCELTDWRVITPNFCEKQHEKNWMPLIIDNNLYFIYSCDPVRIIDINGNLVNNVKTSIAADSFRGGGAALPFETGYLVLLHESISTNDGHRRYMHRFAWFDQWHRLAKITPAFYIKSPGIEFSAGLTKHPINDTLIISFGIKDRESWLAEIPFKEVNNIMKPAGLDKIWLADDVATMNLVNTETNKALDTLNKVRLFQNIAIRSGLPFHEDAQKNWDSVLATYWTTLKCDICDPVMDVAASPGSAFLPGLKKLGFNNLISINLTQTSREIVNGISYQYGDCTNTDFQNDYFGFIACLSVIEHGVDVDKFLAESHRILKKGGYLFISTDYWQDPVDTYGQIAFGVPVKVFNRHDLEYMIAKAKSLGFEITNDVHLECNEKTVEWIGMKYTFINLLLHKV